MQEYTRSQKKLVKEFVEYRLVILEFSGGYQNYKHYIFRIEIDDIQYVFEHFRHPRNPRPVSFYIDKEIERIKKELNSVPRVVGQTTAPGRG